MQRVTALDICITCMYALTHTACADKNRFCAVIVCAQISNFASGFPGLQISNFTFFNLNIEI